MAQIITYTYHYTDQSILIHGFIASLLLQGEEWDIRCVESDARDYHQQYYSRMDAKSALAQEIDWWWHFYEDEHLLSVPRREDLLSAGVYYLLWQAQDLFLPMEEADKLTTDMAIYLNDDHYLYKVNDFLALFPRDGEPNLDFLLHGFAAQLLTYAASCSMEHMLTHPEEYDPILIARMIADWLQSTPTIWMDNILFDIPDVYLLYASYVDTQKTQWDADNKRRYQSQQPQVRYFMTHLLEQLRADANDAIAKLTPYLSPKQLTAYQRYLAECQQYIIDQTQTRRKPQDDSFDQFFCEGVSPYYKQKALERIRTALMQENPTAMLALEVKRLRDEKILLKTFHSYRRFVDILNPMFNTAIKADSFSKHFRRR